MRSCPFWLTKPPPEVLELLLEELLELELLLEELELDELELDELELDELLEEELLELPPLQAAPVICGVSALLPPLVPWKPNSTDCPGWIFPFQL